MPAMPLVTSGAGTLLAYLVLMVALAGVIGAMIGLIAAKLEPTSPKETAERTEVVDHVRKAA